MDEFAFIAIIILLIVLAVPVAIVILFLRNANLTDRVIRLEREVRDQAIKLAMMTMPMPAASAEGADSAAEEPVAFVPEAPEEDTEIAATPPTAEDAPIITASTPERASSSAWDRALAKAPAAAATSEPDMRRTGTASPDDAADNARADSRPYTRGPSRMNALVTWLQTNWIYAISAASLGLAGIFFVQYGMERGLLPPAFRVLAGIAFGGALIAAGEWLRRRHGDEGETATLYLPSVFSGAGLVSVFAATLAARHMYGLISPEVAFAGHLFTAALAVALGWFYGPLLAAVGLIGAALSPFIVAGGSDAAPWLYAYFALLTAVGLGIDAVRQWRWLSVLALCLGYAGGLLTWAAGAGDAGWIIFSVAMAVGSMLIPQLALNPRHAGPFMLQALLGQAAGAWPSHQVRLAGGAAVSSTIGLVLAIGGSADLPVLAAFGLAVLALIYLIWAEKAEGLADLALIPAIGYLLTLALHALGGTSAFWAFQAQDIASRAPESAAPATATVLLALAVAISIAAAWRALRRQDWLLDLTFGLLAVLTAPIAVAIIELLWAPAPVVGLPFWAAQIIGIAALMTGLATRFAAVDMGDMRRAAYATLSALSLVALALFLMTTATALTLALAVLIVVAALLDRRFNLPEMGLFQQIGVAVLSYRLLLDPGLDWAVDGPLLQVILAFTGSIAAMVAAWFLILPHRRSLTRAVLESAAAGLAAIFVDVMILRWLMPDMNAWEYPSHWQFTLWAMPWLILMLAQLYRAQASETLRRLRLGLATVSGAIAAVFIAFAIFPFNPIVTASKVDLAGLVQGPWLINSLFLAYAVPGLILLVVRSRMTGLDDRVSKGFFITGLALLGLYATLAIRHIWQGTWIGGPGVAQGELYTYTLAMMALGAGLLFTAIRKGSDAYRRAAMGVIGLVIAKVFLIDAAGLTGLTRVFSFLGLGLSLAGLAWLNRWADRAAKAQ